MSSIASPSTPSTPTQTPGQGTPGHAVYSVARTLGVCRVCSKAVLPGEKIFAALRWAGDLMERWDVCPACWDAFDRAGLLGSWQTAVPVGNAKKKMFVDDEVLCEVFERLGDATEIQKLNFRFVLGLILMRKRRIVYESSRTEEGRTVWTVRVRGREETLELVDPKLGEQQIAEVTGQLGEILADV